MQGRRIIFIILGWFSLITGILGIFLPLLPGTPFIILAAWCFSKSSERFHAWLTTHRHFGPMVHNWQSSQGVPIRAKKRAILFMWLGMLVSMMLIGRIWATLSLILIGCAVSLYILRLPTRAEDNI